MPTPYAALSIRELKSELSARRIGITGLTEKQELVALLQASLNRAQTGDSSSSDSDTAAPAAAGAASASGAPTAASGETVPGADACRRVTSCAADDFYGILGVERSADADTLRRAYRNLALRLHPDKCRARRRRRLQASRRRVRRAVRPGGAARVRHGRRRSRVWRRFWWRRWCSGRFSRH